MANDFDIAVIGAGAVGLACAARLARAGRSVVVIERLRGVGLETSGRNSGVIHAGLYYPEDSLKARLCVRGRELLYARCVRDGARARFLSPFYRLHFGPPQFWRTDGHVVGSRRL